MARISKDNAMADEGLKLTPAELVQRWRSRVNMRTLANWRSSGQGPRYEKIGGRVLYPLRFVEDYERNRTRGA